MIFVLADVCGTIEREDGRLVDGCASLEGILGVLGIVATVWWAASVFVALGSRAPWRWLFLILPGALGVIPIGSLVGIFSDDSRLTGFLLTWLWCCLLPVALWPILAARRRRETADPHTKAALEMTRIMFVVAMVPSLFLPVSFLMFAQQ